MSNSKLSKFRLSYEWDKNLKDIKKSLKERTI